ncbi:MAG: ATP-binding cassette domain-containing protein [Verrucomicrobia bacterium]|nr:ATP-binding cassette domain-containing protein [Verrucomicrobiota bacterium]
MIVVKDVWKSYKGIPVLKGLNLHVPAGKTLIIVGRSGVGKSVLLRQITGLERPDRGTIEVDGICIGSLKKRDRRTVLKQFGMLFQSSALFDSMSVGENVGFYLKEHNELNKYSQSQIDDLVHTSLTKVGLADMQNKMPSELSGGQKRRAALARVLIYRPKIILCDEPTTGLDPITSMQINELIAETHAELSATTIIVTHDLQSALTLGDLFALHSEGKIASLDTKEGFLQSDNPLIVEFLQNAIISPEYTSMIKKVNHHA